MLFFRNNRSSTASFSLNNKGVYNVTVYVTNSRLQSVYKAAWLPYSIQVQESIAQLNVATSNQRKWAQLYRDKRGLWRTKAVNFTAWSVVLSCEFNRFYAGQRVHLKDYSLVPCSFWP